MTGIETLLGSTDLWLPALRGSFALLSATSSGHAAKEWAENQLGWLSDPEALTAFRSAFSDGVRRFQSDQGNTEGGKAAILVLARLVEEDRTGQIRVEVLQQVFAESPNCSVLSQVIRKREPAVEGLLASENEIVAAIDMLVVSYLRPSFRAHSYFTDRVGFAQIVGLLAEIRDSGRVPLPDLNKLWIDYKAKTIETYELITMQGISPKVQNRTIGIRMEDVYIPVKASPDDTPATQSSSYLTDLLQIELDRSSVESSVENPNNPQLDASSGHLEELVSSAKSESEGPLELDKLLQLPRLVVRGDPGSGKSTLTRYCAWAALTGRVTLYQGKQRIPIRIRAVEFGEAIEAGRAMDLFEYLTVVTGRFSPLISRSIFEGGTLILIDGLDEIGAPSLRTKVKDQVDNFVSDPAFSGNQVIITTRIVGYERSGRTGTFPHVTIVDLDDEQITGFVSNWYRVIRDQVSGELDINAERDQLLDAVLRNESIHRMARNPLLLTIIALIKWQGRTLPEQRVLLYDAAAQTLIKSWPLTQRRVELDELFIREWLAPVAFRIFSDPTNDLIDEYSLMDELVASMRRLRSMTDFDARKASNDLLHDVSEHSGILLPRGTDGDERNLYGFLHQTFGEYLTAHYLTGRWEDGDLNLLYYAPDPYWREVILLMAGHLGTTRRAKAGRLLRDLRGLRSSRFENWLHRDLLLIGEILADGVPVGPGNLVEDLITEMLSIWNTSPISKVRSAFERILGGLKGTEYASVAARISHDLILDVDQQIALAEHLGANHYLHRMQEILNSENPTIRLRGARLLDSDDPLRISVLLPLLYDEDPTIRVEAASALHPHHLTQVRETFLACLVDPDPSLQTRIIQIAKEHGYPYLTDHAMELLGTDNKHSLFADALLESSKDVRIDEMLFELLSSSASTTRVHAARILMKRGNLDAVEQLQEIAESEDMSIAARLEASRALPQRNDTALNTLGALLQSEDKDVRRTATAELARRGEFQLISMEHMLDLSPWDQLIVGDKLLEAGRTDVLKLIEGFLDDKEPYRRIKAAEALAKNGNTEVIDRIQDLLVADNALVAFMAADAVLNCGLVPERKVIERLLTAESLLTRIGIIGNLSTSENEQITELLLPLADNDDPVVRISVLWALANRRDTRAFCAISERLGTMLEDTVRAENVIIPFGYYSVADVAYDFLEQHLLPSGEISNSQLQQAVPQFTVQVKYSGPAEQPTRKARININVNPSGLT